MSKNNVDPMPCKLIQVELDDGRKTWVTEDSIIRALDEKQLRQLIAKARSKPEAKSDKPCPPTFHDHGDTWHDNRPRTPRPQAKTDLREELEAAFDWYGEEVNSYTILYKDYWPGDTKTESELIKLKAMGRVEALVAQEVDKAIQEYKRNAK